MVHNLCFSLLFFRSIPTTSFLSRFKNATGMGEGQEGGPSWVDPFIKFCSRAPRAYVSMSSWFITTYMPYSRSSFEGYS